MNPSPISSCDLAKIIRIGIWIPSHSKWMLCDASHLFVFDRLRIRLSPDDMPRTDRPVSSPCYQVMRGDPLGATTKMHFRCAWTRDLHSLR
ncbi:unnamed protein product [Mycena citricolor]|uniref:Uncharacterized protein n=1 Tax=Mycena citricolor TaxID=2018698 RepID=A0AAD2HQG1_9AGAR|nr:unnamed protein product [Mycena citricolor]